MPQQATVAANKTDGGGAQQQKHNNAYRQKKRARGEESGAAAMKASKVRKSNTGTIIAGHSVASVAPTAEGESNITTTRHAVDAGIRAKHSELFGLRPVQHSTGTEVLKKGKSVVKKATAGKVQPTLLDSFAAITRKGAESHEDKKTDKIVIDLCLSTQVKFSALDNANTSKQLFHNNDVASVSTSSDVTRAPPSERSTTFQTPSTLMPTLLSRELSDASFASTAASDICSSDEDDCRERQINSLIFIAADRELLAQRTTASSLRYDCASYGQDWLLHHKSREQMFRPWQLVLTGKTEKLRLAVIENYWTSMGTFKTTPATVFVAINTFSRLLSHWDVKEMQSQTPQAYSKWALTALVAYRLAFKTEERPETLWDVSNFWNALPIFNDCLVDRSESNVNTMETEALQLLSDSLDVPLASMFLSQYIAAGGWPQKLVEEYHELGLYLISLATFASVNDTQLRNVVPSKLAAGALALAVKIVNGDRGSNHGLGKHLDECESAKRRLGFECVCRYEFWPRRLEIYAGLHFEDLKPVVRGLSNMLRSRPPETSVLGHFYPTWGDNEWQ